MPQPNPHYRQPNSGRSPQSPRSAAAHSDATASYRVDPVTGFNASNPSGTGGNGVNPGAPQVGYGQAQSRPHPYQPPTAPEGYGHATPASRPGAPHQPGDDPEPDDWEYESPPHFWQRWQFWALAGVTVATSIAGVSAAFLLRLPGLPNCPELFMPTASASLRLYCAQAAADKRTIEDLLAAIALIDDLPADHPMRIEVDQQIELWATDILDLADEKFQAGELGAAIAAARQIPSQTGAAELVADRIETWETTWAEAEKIYDETLAVLRQQDFRAAFLLASQLLELNNQYWATTQYQQLNDQIFIARREAEQLNEANTKADQGGVSNLLEAIRLAKAIPSTSYAYESAQTAIQRYVDDLVNLALAAIEEDDPRAAIATARQIPTTDIPNATRVAERVQDLLVLGQAAVIADSDNPMEIQQAIQQAKQLGQDSTLYSQAQRYIGRWQLEIQDVEQLALAQRLATPGGVANLRAAIVEAERVPRNNPRGREAAELVTQWTTQVQTIQDQPILNQAKQVATASNVNAWQQAIALASRIEPGRALYDEAQQNVRTWRRQLETTQDRPILTEAQAIAARGDLRGAIATARRITAGRALYDDARADINRWQTQIDGETALRSAYQAATLGTADGLARAIARADEVPGSSNSRTEADRMRNLWSQELLDMANRIAIADPARAIALARDIPANTTAYTQAQQQIQTWAAQLAPPPPTELEPAPIRPAPAVPPSAPTDESNNALPEASELNLPPSTPAN